MCQKTSGLNKAKAYINLEAFKPKTIIVEYGIVDFHIFNFY